MNFELQLPKEQADKFRLQKSFAKRFEIETYANGTTRFCVRLDDDVDLLSFYTACWASGYNMCIEFTRLSGEPKPVQI